MAFGDGEIDQAIGMEHIINTGNRSGSTRGRLSHDNDLEGIRAGAKKAPGYCQPGKGVNSKSRQT